ncbi:DUF3617 domain-containing protein [Aurantiacibacter gangjinensis]|uniref:Uncharacterized protein n=1 Tax=Aurantiacibacter gangjinensis TaxID=502682 RepID=A0A0G9MMV1_9SPHN|nr:DUF3617 family protein [Aurantiacibacter gangjinensis]APE28162.1 hypothetical protein BMF35_a1333 [Aurantiacibacter gangjinensis]KLE32071.1 hypothetical protein AAW01_11690 [Aurantiacibacter gangjinensis]
MNKDILAGGIAALLAITPAAAAWQDADPDDVRAAEERIAGAVGEMETDESDVAANERSGSVADGELSSNEPYPWPDFMNVTPIPGRYKMKISLVDVDLSDNSLAAALTTPEMLAENFAETETYCVAPGSQRSERWLGDLSDDDCSALETTVDGNSFTHVLQCTEDDGTEITLAIDGDVYDDRARMDVQVDMNPDDTGPVSLKMRIASNRTGDCD